MSRYPSCIALWLTLLLLAVPALAGEPGRLFNTVTLQSQAEREVPNDQMTVLLAVEHQGADPATLSEQVNRDMAWALERLEGEPAIDGRTRAYSTRPIYDDRVISGWRVRQELELESEEFDAVTALLGTLQERLLITRMGFTPKSETRDRHEDELIGEALSRFKERIALVQEHMEDRDYRIIELNLQTGRDEPPNPLMHRAGGMETDARSAPAAQAGTSRVTVTVSGSVQFY